MDAIPRTARLARLTGGAALAGLVLGVWSFPAAAGSPEDGQATYRPIQNISYTFGSKFLSGYFIKEAATCLISLMVIERSDPDAPGPHTATRVRLMLHPGQIAGLDSEEGRSLNITCTEGANALLVQAGDRQTLVSLQTLATKKEIALQPPAHDTPRDCFSAATTL